MTDGRVRKMTDKDRLDFIEYHKGFMSNRLSTYQVALEIRWEQENPLRRPIRRATLREAIDYAVECGDFSCSPSGQDGNEQSAG